MNLPHDFQPRRIYIVNIGRGNYLWPKCHKRPSVATLNDADLHELWRAGDRAEFIKRCVSRSKTARGFTLPNFVASRWFNLATIVSESAQDIWIHRQQDELWWTVSSGALHTEELQPPEDLQHSGRQVVEIHKPTLPWSSQTRKGARLSWGALHPRAKQFLFTEGTLQKLTDSNALYAWELIQGKSLEAWHTKAEFQKNEAARRAPVSILDERQRSIATMVMRAMETARNANGQIVERVQKNKEFLFDSYDQGIAYVSELWELQEGLCAISQIPLQQVGSAEDPWMCCSLDRVDSQGHYALGNLQIVCRFVNRWKSDMEDQEFRRLFALVQGIPSLDADN